MGQKPAKTRKTKIAAGATGGGGSALIALVQKLPEENPYKSLFIIAAPSISGALAIVWLWLQDHLKGYLDNIAMEYHANKAKEIIDNAKKNDEVSDEKKAVFQIYWEQILEKRIKSKMDKIDKLTKK